MNKQTTVKVWLYLGNKNILLWLGKAGGYV